MTTLQQMLKSLPKDRQAHIQAQADELIIDYRLQLLCEALQAESSELTNTPTITDIKHYVDALGGQLSIDVQLPSGKRIGVTI